MSRITKKLAQQNATICQFQRGMVAMTARVASMETTVTGLRIGIATVPRQAITPTADALALQQALTDRRVNDAGHRVLNWVLAVFGVGLAVSFAMGWI